MITLRDYQNEAVEAVCRELRKARSTMGVAATGAGKTIVFSALANIARGRVLVVCPTRELVTQTAEKIHAVTGTRPEIEMAEQRSREHGALFMRNKFAVASKQSLERRLGKYPPNAFTLVVIDECHYAVAGGYMKIIDHFAAAKIFGVTATPKRHDKLSMNNVFESRAFEYPLPSMIERGWLVEADVATFPLLKVRLPELSGSRRDYTDAELARIMDDEGPCQEIVKGVLKAAGDKRTIIFTPSVSMARRVAEILNRPSNKPGSAAFACAETPERIRRPIIEGFRSGRIQYFSNYGLATHGFDVPECECVAIARFTKSVALLSQMFGRATRPWPGVVDGPETAEDRRAAIARSRKPRMLCIDYEDQMQTMDIARPYDIMSGRILTPEERREMQIAARKAGGEAIGVSEQIKAAFDRVEASRKERARQEFERSMEARRAGIDFDADIEVEITPLMANLGIMPKARMVNRGKPIDNHEMKVLLGSGIDIGPMTQDQKRATYNAIIQRRIKGLLSFKQAKVLKNRGYENAYTMKRSEGKPILDRIFGNTMGSFR